MTTECYRLSIVITKCVKVEANSMIERQSLLTGHLLKQAGEIEAAIPEGWMVSNVDSGRSYCIGDEQHVVADPVPTVPDH